MFVSESFLIGSAEDKKAVIIEKTPDTIAVYDPQRNYILCANHFQSKGWQIQMLMLFRRMKTLHLIATSVYRS
jgi:hypothetical protein